MADWEGSVEVEFEFGAVEMPDDEYLEGTIVKILGIEVYNDVE